MLLLRVASTARPPLPQVFLSECAARQDVTSAGCGQQLAAQTFGVTNGTGAGSVAFVVRDQASSRAYDRSSDRRCVDQCVLVATVGIGGGYASARLSFAKGIAGAHVLGPAGIGPVQFGTAKATAVAGLRRLFGKPSSQGANTGCGPR